MKARFVKIVENEAEASYSRHNMHFKYLNPTPKEKAALVEQAKGWSIIRYSSTEYDHEEYGSYTDTNPPKLIPLTELNDFVLINGEYYYVEAGTVIVEDGKIIGVAMTDGVIYADDNGSDSCKSRSVHESGRQTERESSSYKLVRNESIE